ncbi:hypothetical protein [Occultella kanbiaonis]|uniref:hypothetical protein n=1 Tax=Occultella kanbiaonis TaxID=2675754 RepID=UPI0012B88E94|nr:hypothetical protein [Occultella kanbiaonis]
MGGTEWVTAVAAIGALAAAIWAGITARDLYRVETDRDQRSEDDRRRAQATQVAAWIVIELEADADTPRGVGVVVHNSSDSVIYDVEIETSAKNGRTPKPIRMELLPPGDYYLREKHAHPRGWAFARSTEEVLDATLRPVTTSRDLRVQSLTFRDSADLRWRRTRNGELVGVRDDAAPADPAH